MNEKNIVILGTGGMAREVYDLVIALYSKNNICGFMVQEKYFVPNQRVCGLPVYSEHDSQFSSLSSFQFVDGISSPAKITWIQQLSEKGAQFLTLVAKNSSVPESCSIGEGSIICPGVVITHQVSIGRHTIVNISSSISHDAVIGSFSHISPGVHIAGNTRIGDGTWIGIGASVIHTVAIGETCMVGAGTVVTENLPSGFVYVGVPARPIKKIALSDWGTLI